MENKVIRVLQVVPNMRSAGIENFIMNTYRNIDKDKVQFDFLVHSQKPEMFDNEIEKLGGKIYRLTYKDDKNLIKYIRDLNIFFKEHKEYQIVHGEMQSMMPLYLYIARRNHVKIRIAHAHNSSYEKTPKGFILHLFSKFSKIPANVYWACSITAGEYLFPNRKFEVINNAIDQSIYSFNPAVRNKIRNDLNINGKFVIGHIGRFEVQKNHKFLIDIFYEVTKINGDAVLMCIGDGKLKEIIEEKVKELGIEEKVIFMGVVKNSYDYYQCMDCFILPSLYEGLPLVGVEAQISGLKCFFSNTITNELNLTKGANYIDLNSSATVWANEICKKNTIERATNYIADYDLEIKSKEIEKKYINFFEK